MAKSYKITFIKKFDNDAFELAPYILNRQYNMEGVPPEPQTKIYKARDTVSIEDFEKYIIEHEMEETAFGRYSTFTFNKYIRREYIQAFESKENKMLLLSGKKRYILDFCKKTEKINEVKIQTINVDMSKLLSKLPHVKGVWFRFDKGAIKSSALMGANIEATSDFQRYKTVGDISTLSFHYELEDALHPIMVTNDGAIVLYSVYTEISAEISIVLDIERNLLMDVLT